MHQKYHFSGRFGLLRNLYHCAISPIFTLNRSFFFNGPFWDMSKNGGLQIFVKMHLKYSTYGYGPEHKTERFRSIEVIVNFWELVEIGKIYVFWQKQLYGLSGKVVKEIFQYSSLYDFDFFLGVQKIKLLQKIWPGSSVIVAVQKSWFSPTTQSVVTCQINTFFGFFLVFGTYWTDSVQKLCTLCFQIEKNCLWMVIHDFDNFWSK
jgi:hypothetical protein